MIQCPSELELEACREQIDDLESKLLHEIELVKEELKEPQRRLDALRVQQEKVRQLRTRCRSNRTKFMETHKNLVQVGQEHYKLDRDVALVYSTMLVKL